MPVILSFRLNPAEAAELPPYPGRALHALFYQWLALGDYTLSTQVHSDEGPRPFTVAPLQRHGNQTAFRFTVLDDALWPALERGIALTPAVVVLNRPLTLSPTGAEVRQQTYAELAAQASLKTSFTFRFASPTSFRSREMHFPLPDPRLVFQSWLLRWNEFAPQELQINIALLDIVEAHLAISRYDLRTQMADWGANKKMVGFVGTIQYIILRTRDIGNEWLQHLNVLANYAPYCGTGHKTAQGMGQTERLA